MERWLESHVCGAFSSGYILRAGLGQVTEMIEWNEQCLKELVRKMGLRRTPGQGKPPIHLSLYGSRRTSRPLLAAILELGLDEWALLGYTETDRVSVIRYLGSLGCRTDNAWSAAARNLTLELAKALLDAGVVDKDALSVAAKYQRPLTLELAKTLIDAGAFDKEALSFAAWRQRPLNLDLAKLLIDAEAFDEEALSKAAEHQRPLTLELAKLLIDAGCDPAAQDGDGWDSLVCLACGSHPVDLQVTDLFLSAGCRTDLGGCSLVSNKHRLRFEQILKEHAEWKLTQECVPADTSYGPDWGR